jgi:type IV pilus assembly protein PilQ
MRTLSLAVLVVASSAFAAAPKRVSFEFANADVHSVLRLFSEVGHFNLVTSEAVTGKVTVTLRNVPWDVAMNAVLAAKGLGLERTDNIVRVAPLSQLADEAAQRARLQEAKFATLPLKTSLIRVNYASAAEMAQQVKATLSPRGTVSVDTRTNTLIIRDVDE